MVSSPKKSLDRTRFPASVSVKQPERVKAARAETGIGRLLGRAVAVEKSPERSGAAKRPNERDGMAMTGLCQGVVDVEDERPQSLRHRRRALVYNVLVVK